jgi:hypothetical protein
MNYEKNTEELINLELHRAHIALGQGLVRKANEHMDNARLFIESADFQDIAGSINNDIR